MVKSDARAQVTTEIGGKKASKLWIEPSFDWRCVCKPIMPGNPDWCPATHFGIIEQGCMKVERDSGVVSNLDRVVRPRRARRAPPGDFVSIAPSPTTRRAQVRGRPPGRGVHRGPDLLCGAGPHPEDSRRQDLHHGRVRRVRQQDLREHRQVGLGREQDLRESKKRAPREMYRRGAPINTPAARTLTTLSRRRPPPATRRRRPRRSPRRPRRTRGSSRRRRWSSRRPCRPTCPWAACP